MHWLAGLSLPPSPPLGRFHVVLGFSLPLCRVLSPLLSTLHVAEASVASPKLVEALADAKVKQVTCSQLHTVFVTGESCCADCAAR
jgi:hypothetical protein